jgi:CubicO group peptidase (beta-lactamase class C family)
VREVGKPDLVDADTVFQLASVSKPLGSTVIAGLVSDKVVTWDDRIIDHDPGFQMHDPYVTAALTIRDTYSHRSGLPDHVGDLLEDMGYDRAEVLRRLRGRQIVGRDLPGTALQTAGHELHKLAPV